MRRREEGGEQGVALGWIESFNGPELIGFRMVIIELELNPSVKSKMFFNVFLKD